MATFATAAEWYDEIADLTTFPKLGRAYVSEAPIFVAFGIPSAVAATELKNNWTDGAVASYVSATDYSSTGTVAKVDDTTQSSFAHITAPAQLDIMSDTAGGSYAFEMSAADAVEAIYDKFVEGSINGNNTLNQLSGFETFLTAQQATPVSTDCIVSGLEANVLKELDNVRAQLSTGGNYLILTSTTGWGRLKNKMRGSGGTTPVHEGLRNFGFGNILDWDGIPVLPTRQITTVGAADEYFYMVNLGPNGCKLVAPTGKTMWLQDGPKSAKGEIAKWWDYVLRCQLLYLSPRAVGRAQITMS